MAERPQIIITPSIYNNGDDLIEDLQQSDQAQDLSEASVNVAEHDEDINKVLQNNVQSAVDSADY